MSTVSNKSLRHVTESKRTNLSTMSTHWFILQHGALDHITSFPSESYLDRLKKLVHGPNSHVFRLWDELSEVQSRCLLKLSNLAGCPVQVTPHRTMNTSKGVIRCKELVNCTKEEILSELQDQSVKDIYNISVKTDSGNRRNTNTFIVTFSTATTPKYLKIGYIRVPVSIYIPNPLRCFKCQRFGHGSRTCKGDTRCANCGQVGHNSSDCHEQPKCCNCSGTHSASSKECPKWVLEKKVQQIKAEKGVSFVDSLGA